MAGGAPGRAIAREAMESAPPEPIVTSAESPDYGREIELPDEIPPPTPRSPAMATAPASMHHASVPEAAAPASTRPSPEPVRRAAAPQPAVPSERAVDRQPHSAGVKAAEDALVVPVKLPPNGKTGEIVIRIVFERQD